jgi:hypothetical protein
MLPVRTLKRRLKIKPKKFVPSPAKAKPPKATQSLIGPGFAVKDDLVTDAQKFLCDVLGLPTVNAEPNALIAALEGSRGKLKHISNAAKVAKIQHAYSHLVALSDPARLAENIALLRKWAKDNGHRITQHTKPVHIVLRALIDYDDNPKTRSSLLARDANAIRYLASIAHPPSEVLKLSRRRGEGLEHWSKRGRRLNPKRSQKPKRTQAAGQREAKAGDLKAAFQALEFDRSKIWFMCIDPRGSSASVQVLKAPLTAAMAVDSHWEMLRQAVTDLGGEESPSMLLPRPEASDQEPRLFGPDEAPDHELSDWGSLLGPLSQFD